MYDSRIKFNYINNNINVCTQKNIYIIVKNVNYMGLAIAIVWYSILKQATMFKGAQKCIHTKNISKNERQEYKHLPVHNNSMTRCITTEPRRVTCWGTSRWLWTHIEVIICSIVVKDKRNQDRVTKSPIYGKDN